MLYLAPWNLSYQVAYCAQTYDVIARPYWIPVSFGGYNLQGASNIVFSNGNLDPWSGGGVTRNITGAPSIVAIVIEGVCLALPFTMPYIEPSC
jgi:lysosomal Pro-X carboxypeptidase